MKYLGMDLETLNSKGAIRTAKEICQQPDVWQKVWLSIYQNQSDISQFLNSAMLDSGQIILTGAGTSAFIGLSLSGIFFRNTKIATKAVSTTGLSFHPKDYLSRDTPLLMISFARSGNSPESVAAVSLADELCDTCFHLIITCNAEGALARYGNGESNNKYVFTLPEEANDESLAMTSSYTGMLLAGILIAEITSIASNKTMVDTLAHYGRKVINYYFNDFRIISEKNFKRAVFLGSGPLSGTATESHLKVQELTDGKIICKDDSFLGFRHGPKAVIDETTLVVYIFSNDGYVLKYERDMVTSMKKGNSPLLEIGIMEKDMPDVSLDYSFSFSDNGMSLREDFLAVCSVVPAQLLAFFKSLQLGLQPDTPSVTGAISRVVEGFPIYDLKK
ncbi:MAG TPA: SIS domain-containing protein [Flavitalea sp.]|nr:SIS domain-containing protein [Flavitalea sp.]